MGLPDPDLSAEFPVSVEKPAEQTQADGGEKEECEAVGACECCEQGEERSQGKIQKVHSLKADETVFFMDLIVLLNPLVGLSFSL